MIGQILLLFLFFFLKRNHAQTSTFANESNNGNRKLQSQDNTGDLSNIELVLAYSTGHVGTTSFSKEATYCINKDNCEIRKSVLFRHEAYSILFDNYVEWSKEGIYIWVKNNYLTNIKRDLLNANKSCFFDVGHHNLYFIEGLLRVINETKVNHSIIRIRRHRVEVALSLLYSSSRGSDPVANLLFRYHPFKRQEDLVLNVTRQMWNNFSNFQRALWLVDETEERWLKLKMKFPLIRTIDIYWETENEDGSNEYSFEAAALKIAKIIGYKNKTSLPTNAVYARHTPESMKQQISSRESQLKLMEEDKDYQEKLGVDFTWSYLPKSYNQFHI